MAQVVIFVEECRAKVSPNCTKTFERIKQKGRPALSCPPCREFNKTPRATKRVAKKAAPVKVVIATSMEHECNSDGWDCMVNNDVVDHNKMGVSVRKCPCGTDFKIMPGRGRKASKCQSCREAGIVYRVNDEGELAVIRAETLAEEQREKAEQAGKDRAERLFNLMQPLIARDSRRRELAKGSN